MRRKGRAIATVAILLILGAIGIAWLNPRLTHHIESDHFRAELAKETAKGLHFPSGQYAPIHRTGFLSATSDGFRARNGCKAMKSMDAHGITARFNPLGFFLRRWQLDDVHIRSGEVEIQTYAPTPEPSPAKPWFHIFLPQRVYLKLVESEPADVTWCFRGEKGDGAFIGHDRRAAARPESAHHGSVEGKSGRSARTFSTPIWRVVEKHVRRRVTHLSSS